MDLSRIPDEVLARAILKEALGAEALWVARFATGNHHYVYDCQLADGGQVVVRITDARNRAVMIDAARCSDLLRPLGVKLPEIIARGFAEDLAYLVLARLPGTDLGHVIDALTREHRAGIAAEVARMQAIAATLPSSGRYGYAVRPEEASHRSWSGVLHASLDRSQRRIVQAAVMDPSCVARVRTLVEREREALDRQPPTCFLHDTTTKNVIVKDGRLSGIVDVDDFCFGDPRLALALTRMSLLNTRGPVDYVAAWADAGSLRLDRQFALYTAIFCVDFMAEVGQRFNGNPVAGPAQRAHLEAILAQLLDEVG